LNIDAIEFVQRAQHIDFKQALAYLGDSYGVPVSQQPLTPAQRSHYGKQERDYKLELPAACRWHRAGVLMAEEVLAKLKDPLGNTKCGSTDWQEILDVERVLARLRRLHGRSLVDEYRAWHRSHPQLTRAMVYAVEIREHAEMRALDAYWRSLETRGELPTQVKTSLRLN
jgi:hypothetical protein